MIFVTGASGFVGRALILGLARKCALPLVAGMHRRQILDWPSGVLTRDVGLSDTDFRGVSTVIHLAARVHVMRESKGNPLAAFREINVDTTLHLARLAAAAGVRRFVFVSSVKVNGETSVLGSPLTELHLPNPQDSYAVSKWEAEQVLVAIAASTGMELVIIRPPLVYGPGVTANFASLMRVVQRGIPLPLGSVNNLRSLVGLDNLVDFIMTCAEHPAAANETFFVSDGDDISTPDLIRALARASQCPARLFSVPVGMLTAIASIVGRRAELDRLCSSLQLDISKARRRLQWVPPATLDQGLRQVFATGTNN